MISVEIEPDEPDPVNTGVGTGSTSFKEIA
jgi:hypothetical protein